MRNGWDVPIPSPCHLGHLERYLVSKKIFSPCMPFNVSAVVLRSGFGKMCGLVMSPLLPSSLFFMLC